MKFLNYLRFLLLSWIAGNPLVCTKDLVWLQIWMRSHPAVVRDLDQVTCQTPYGNFSKVFDFDFSLLGELFAVAFAPLKKGVGKLRV